MTCPERFLNNLLELCSLSGETLDYLQEGGYELKIGSGTLNLARGFIAGMDKVKCITGFIERSHPHWLVIKKKEHSFFVENASVIFDGIPEKYVNSFTEIFTLEEEDGSPAVPEETMDSFWAIIHAMIKISIKHIHVSREPKVVDGKRKYTVNYCPGISVTKSVKEWGVKL